MKQVMLDLETMGTEPYSAIIAIGAVVFDIDSREIKQEFYTAVQLESCMKVGLSVQAGTIEWWMKQSDSARAAVTGPARILTSALYEFSWQLDSDTILWGNGSDFDNVLLRCAYQKCGMEVPWSPFNNRCYRTIKNLPQHRNNKIVRVGTHHNALDDAKSQALHLISLLNPEKTNEAG